MRVLILKTAEMADIVRTLPVLEFLRALELRLRESEAANPALALMPIGG